MSKTTLDQLTAQVLEFRRQRQWEQFHTPKELAVSLVVEAAELLELMQWKSGVDLEKAIAQKRGQLADELGDCLHSILLLANDLQIDLTQAFEQKLAKVALKYPVEKSRGRADKYNELK